MPLSMSDPELALYVRWVQELTGIALDAQKRYLLEGRLHEVLAETGCGSYEALYRRGHAGDRAIERRVIDAISTNETSFFRDAKFFELIRHKLVPERLGDDLKRRLSIWSAAASTGQEAYTIAMSLEEILFDLSRCNVTIVGTDISEAAVNAANKAEFGQLEIERGLDPRRIAKHFTRVGPRYKVRDELRAICQFRVDNLLAPRTTGPFDVVLCRNVLIYFSAADKAKVVGHLLARLKPGGALIIGATESLLGVTDRLRRLEFHGAPYYLLK